MAAVLDSDLPGFIIELLKLTGINNHAINPEKGWDQLGQ